MKIKCVIFEDEPFAMDLMKDYVMRTGSLELVGTFSDPTKGLAFISEQPVPVQLAFLDINMPDLSGLEISKLLKDRVRVIFTTAYKDYALDGYRVNALDYLLKPFDYDEFMEAVKKAEDYFDRIADNTSDDKEIVVRAEHKQYRIKLGSILFIENLKNYVIFRLEDGSKVMALMSLKSLNQSLPDNFVKVHRSYIVNLDKIERTSSNAIQIDKFEVPIAESKRKTFKIIMNSKSIN